MFVWVNKFLGLGTKAWIKTFHACFGLKILAEFINGKIAAAIWNINLKNDKSWMVHNFFKFIILNNSGLKNTQFYIFSSFYILTYSNTMAANTEFDVFFNGRSYSVNYVLFVKI